MENKEPVMSSEPQETSTRDQIVDTLKAGGSLRWNVVRCWVGLIDSSGKHVYFRNDADLTELFSLFSELKNTGQLKEIERYKMDGPPSGDSAVTYALVPS
jgi:hypothetical protein